MSGPGWGMKIFFSFFFHDSSASVCARMMLALAVHVSQRTEKKKKQKRGEFVVGCVVLVRGVAEGTPRFAAAAVAAALGALLRHLWLAGVCLVAKLLPEFADFELIFLGLAHAK